MLFYIRGFGIHRGPGTNAPQILRADCNSVKLEDHNYVLAWIPLEYNYTWTHVKVLQFGAPIKGRSLQFAKLLAEVFNLQCHKNLLRGRISMVTITNHTHKKIKPSY